MSGPALRPAVVLLAAGASRRLGEPKALVRLRTQCPGSPLELLLSAARGIDPRPLVVAGPHSQAIRNALADEPDVEVLEHPTWERGRSGSVLAAVQARMGRDLVIAPVDVPLVGPRVFRRLAQRWRSAGSPARGWLAPCAVDETGTRRHGHPVVIGRDLCAQLRDHPPDRPLRSLRALAEPLLDIEVDTLEILRDLDTPADLEDLQVRLARNARR